MRVKWIGIVALVCAVLALLAYATIVFGNLARPIFLFSLVLASIAAFAGDRCFAVPTLLVCLFTLIFGSLSGPGYSLFTFHSEGDTALRTLIVIGFLGPIAGLFFRSVREKKKIASFIPASFTLLIVLVTLLSLDILRVGTDWGWKHEVAETPLDPVSQEPCFSEPNALCVLNLARDDGLATRAYMLTLIKLSVELKAANITAAREIRTEVLKAAEHALNQVDNPSFSGSCKYGTLSAIASLQAELGRTAASEDTLNRALQIAEGEDCRAGGSRYIAMVQVKAGRYEKALQIAQRPGFIDPPAFLAFVARKQAMSGNVAEALRTVGHSDSGRHDIVRIAAVAGKMAVVQQFFARVFEPGEIEYIPEKHRSMLAPMLAYAGDIDGALISADQNNDIGNRAIDLGDVSWAFAQSNQGDVRQDLLDRIHTTLSDMRNSKHINSHAWRGIAIAQVHAGDIEGAIRTASGHQSILTEIAVVLAEKNQFDTAMDVARRVGSKKGRVLALGLVASLMIDSGDLQTAQKTLVEAQENARGLSNGPFTSPTHERDQALSQIGPIQALAGDRVGASETIQNIEDTNIEEAAIHAHAVQGTVNARVFHDDLVGALSIVWNIPDRNARPKALSELALAIGRQVAGLDHRTAAVCALDVVRNYEKRRGASGIQRTIEPCYGDLLDRIWRP